MNHSELMVAIRIERPSYLFSRIQDGGSNMPELNCMAQGLFFQNKVVFMATCDHVYNL